MTEVFVADTRVETALLTSGWWILKPIEHRHSESGGQLAAETETN